MNLYQMRIPLVNQLTFQAWSKLLEGKSLLPKEEARIDRINRLIKQFLQADGYVFVSPLWNLSIPPMLKAYIDVICFASKTFQAKEDHSLNERLKSRKVVHIQARGGIYSEGPLQEYEFGDRYLRAILGYLGLVQYESIIVEGMLTDPTRVEEIMEKANGRAREVAKWFAQEKIEVSEK